MKRSKYGFFSGLYFPAVISKVIPVKSLESITYMIFRWLSDKQLKEMVINVMFCVEMMINVMSCFAKHYGEICYKRQFSSKIEKSF